MRKCWSFAYGILNPGVQTCMKVEYRDWFILLKLTYICWNIGTKGLNFTEKLDQPLGVELLSFPHFGFCSTVMWGECSGVRRASLVLATYVFFFTSVLGAWMLNGAVAARIASVIWS